MLFLKMLLTNPTFFFTTVAIVIGSVMVHELAHGWMAMSQGDDTPRMSGHMTLNPVKLISWQSLIFLCVTGVAWGQMPVNPTRFRWGKLSSILVFSAGPLANLALSFVMIEIYKLSGSLTFLQMAQPKLLLLAAQTNLILFLLNFIPIPPLDGFQVVCELVPPLKAWRQNRWGLFALMLLLLIPAFGTGLTVLARTFVYGAIV